MRPHALLSAIVGFMSAFALLGLPSRADLALNVQPARFELEASPGESKTIPITIRNDGAVPTHVVVSTNDFSIDSAGHYAFLPPGSTRYSSAKWGVVNPREFDIEAGTTVQVRYTVTVPHGTRGEYRSLIFFATRPSRRPGALALSEKVASRMYVLVRDTAKVNGNVVRVVARDVAAGHAYDVTFKNTGNLHVYVNGYIDIKSGGNLIERVKLPADQVVEREGERTITTEGKPLSPGSYTATAVLDFGGDSRVGGQATFVAR